MERPASHCYRAARLVDRSGTGSVATNDQINRTQDPGREDFQRAAVAVRSLADVEGSRMVRRRVTAEFRRAVLADEGGLGKGRDASVVPVATVGIVVVGFSGEDIVRIEGGKDHIARVACRIDHNRPPRRTVAGHDDVVGHPVVDVTEVADRGDEGASSTDVHPGAAARVDGKVVSRHAASRNIDFTIIAARAQVESSGNCQRTSGNVDDVAIAPDPGDQASGGQASAANHLHTGANRNVSLSGHGSDHGADHRFRIRRTGVDDRVASTWSRRKTSGPVGRVRPIGICAAVPKHVGMEGF